MNQVPYDRDQALKILLADHEDFRADNRALVIGFGAAFLLYLSGRYAYERKKKIMQGQFAPEAATKGIFF